MYAAEICSTVVNRWRVLLLILKPFGVSGRRRFFSSAASHGCGHKRFCVCERRCIRMSPPTRVTVTDRVPVPRRQAFTVYRSVESAHARALSCVAKKESWRGCCRHVYRGRSFHSSASTSRHAPRRGRKSWASCVCASGQESCLAAEIVTSAACARLQLANISEQHSNHMYRMYEVLCLIVKQKVPPRGSNFTHNTRAPPPRSPRAQMEKARLERAALKNENYVRR